jgi:hypothetical protein
VKRKMLATEDAPIEDEVNDEEIEIFLLKETKKANNLLREVTVMHELMAENLWLYKLRQK